MRIIRSRKQAKMAEGAQRKDLVNEISLKANKPKSKGYDNWVRES